MPRGPRRPDTVRCSGIDGSHVGFAEDGQRIEVPFYQTPEGQVPGSNVGELSEAVPCRVVSGQRDAMSSSGRESLQLTDEFKAVNLACTCVLSGY